MSSIRAVRLDEHAVWEELRKRLDKQTRIPGEFIRVHVAPKSGADVSDEWGCRLVILPPEQTHLAKSGDSPALVLAREILESRGTGPRMHKNTLALLAADKSRINDLEQAVRHFLAWSSIVADRETLNLDAFQSKQAETQKSNWDQAVTMRIPETYQWLLLPDQSDPKGSAGWKQVRLQGQHALVGGGSFRYHGRFPPAAGDRQDPSIAVRWLPCRSEAVNGGLCPVHLPASS
jgi:hypothetical protein